MVIVGWTEKMKITKSRLLQIIREEVELHEKNLEENFIVIDEAALEELTKEDGKKAIEDEIESDKMKQGDVEEDKLLDPKTKKPINGTKPR